MSSIIKELEDVHQIFHQHITKVKYIIKDFKTVIEYLGGNISYSFQNDISINPRLILHIHASNDQVYDILSVISKERPRLKLETLYRIGSDEILMIADYDIDWEKDNK